MNSNNDMLESDLFLYGIEIADKLEELREANDPALSEILVNLASGSRPEGKSPFVQATAEAYFDLLPPQTLGELLLCTATAGTSFAAQAAPAFAATIGSSAFTALLREWESLKERIHDFALNPIPLPALAPFCGVYAETLPKTWRQFLPTRSGGRGKPLKAEQAIPPPRSAFLPGEAMVFAGLEKGYQYRVLLPGSGTSLPLEMGSVTGTLSSQVVAAHFSSEQRWELQKSGNPASGKWISMDQGTAWLLKDGISSSATLKEYAAADCCNYILQKYLPRVVAAGSNGETAVEEAVTVAQFLMLCFDDCKDSRKGEYLALADQILEHICTWPQAA